MISIKILKNAIQIKKQKMLIIFDEMTADILSNKKLNPIVTELFIGERKLNISLVFITQSYFAVPKNIRLNSTHYFIMKIPDKRELQQIVFKHLPNTDFQYLIKFYRKYTTKLHSFLVINTTLSSDTSSCFRKNLLERI